MNQLHVNDWHENDSPDWAVDDVSGSQLDPEGVKIARRLEIKHVHDKRVWKKISRRLAQQHGYKIIKTRRIYINKGDAESPNYRSRFVAKEFNTGDQDGLFASTPPIEAVR